MNKIEELVKEVASIEERFLTGDDQKVMDPWNLTDAPPDSSSQDTAMRSNDIDGTVYVDDNVPPMKNPEVEDPDQETPEQKEVTAHEELSLCIDLVTEAITRAKEVVSANSDVVSEEMMKKIESASDLMLELVDMSEEIAYDYDDKDQDDDEMMDQNTDVNSDDDSELPGTDDSDKDSTDNSGE